MAVEIGGFFAELALKVNDAGFREASVLINRLTNSLRSMTRAALEAQAAYERVGTGGKSTSRTKKEETTDNTNKKTQTAENDLKKSENVNQPINKGISETAKEEDKAAKDILKERKESENWNKQLNRLVSQVDVANAKSITEEERKRLALMKEEAKIERERRAQYNRGKRTFNRGRRNAKKGVTRIAEGVGVGAAVVGGITAATEAFSKLGRESLIQAKQTGMSINQLNMWKLSAEQAGIAGDDMANAIAGVNEKLQRIAIGEVSEDQARAFALLGLGQDYGITSDEQGKNSSQKTQDILNAALAMKDSQKAAQIVDDLLGDAGKRYFWTLKQSNETLDSQLEKAKKLSFTDQQSKENAMAFANSMSTLFAQVKEMGEKLFSNIGAGLTPTIKSITEWISKNKELIQTKLAEWGDKIVKIFNGLVEAGKTLAPLFETLLNTAAALAPYAGQIATAFLVFEGGRIVFGVAQMASGFATMLSALKGIRGIGGIAGALGEASGLSGLAKLAPLLVEGAPFVVAVAAFGAAIAVLVDAIQTGPFARWVSSITPNHPIQQAEVDEAAVKLNKTRSDRFFLAQRISKMPEGEKKKTAISDYDKQQADFLKQQEALKKDYENKLKILQQSGGNGVSERYISGRAKAIQEFEQDTFGYSNEKDTGEYPELGGSFQEELDKSNSLMNAFSKLQDLGYRQKKENKSFQENGPYGNLPLPITNPKQEKTTIDLNITHSPTGQKKTISLPIGGMVSTIFNLGKATAATINGQSTQ